MRWLSSCGVDRESRTGKLERQHKTTPKPVCNFSFLSVLSVDCAQRPSKEETEDTARNCYENRSNIYEKSPNIDKNSLLGGFGRSKPVRERVGTRLGRPKAAPGAILGRPRCAKNGWESSKSVPGPVPRHFRTPPERCPSLFRASNIVEQGLGTIWSFWFRCAKVPKCEKCKSCRCFVHCTRT